MVTASWHSESSSKALESMFIRAVFHESLPVVKMVSWRGCWPVARRRANGVNGSENNVGGRNFDLPALSSPDANPEVGELMGLGLLRLCE